MPGTQDRLTKQQRALLDELATINSFDYLPTLHYWVRDYCDINDSCADELTLAPAITALVTEQYVTIVSGGTRPQYLTTPSGWEVLGDVPNSAMHDLWHDYLGYPVHVAAVGA